MLGDHGAMEIEIDSVERARGLDQAQEPAGDALIGIALNMRRGRGRAPEQWDDLVLASSPAEETGDRQVDSVEGAEDRRAFGEARPAVRHLEVAIGRLQWREGVGLVLKSADGDSRHKLL